MNALRTLLGLSVATLAGCSSVTTPRVWVTGATITERTDAGTVITFDLRAENPNKDALPLREVRYELAIDGITVFEGTRSAQSTLRAFGEQTFRLPAAAAGTWPAGPIRYRLAGEVEYVLPGAIQETLSDSGLPQPTAKFEGEGEATGL